jgi:hypothetical protein
MQAVKADFSVMLKQIGMGNVLAISGGRYERYGESLVLPIRYGYAVRVSLMPNDLYKVERIFKRGIEVKVKKEWSDIYCEQLGEVAYQASCYRD